ncbi:MAG: agglutinin biogenesis protein MshI [Pseudomonadota bacterium]
MLLFRRTKQEPGWLAIGVFEDGMGLAHVQRIGAARPQVLRYEYHRIVPDDVDAWRKLRKDRHLERFNCTTLLNPGEYQMLLVEAPNVPPAELKSAIRWRVNDMLDYHVDDATMDVLDIPADKNAPSRQHSMYAVVARNEILQKREALFEEAKIPLAVIDIPEMAQRNIAACVEQEGRALALLSFDEEGGLLTFTSGGELYLARHLEIGFKQLRDADEELQRQFFERVTLEVQRSLDHFDHQYHYLALGNLVIAPLPAGIALRDYLADNLYMPVEMLDLGAALDFSAVPQLAEAEQQVQAFYVLGAALRQEGKAL